jgi:predicted deacylase
MPERSPKKDVGQWGKVTIAPGERREVKIAVSESYSGADVKIPVMVWRGAEAGPTVFVTAAVHGDELNGAGAILRMILEEPFELRAGSLILAPVVNILGFERHSRYLPDRRDLNRSFPGSSTGSSASRLARCIFDEIVIRSDYGIDLHTAAVRRTNFPNVRADMSNAALAPIARAFGSELIVDGKGPKGSLRRSACYAGRPTLILEAGEVWKVESAVGEYAMRGVRNCLIHFGMVDGETTPPPFQLETDATTWVRATYGGFLRFHVAPGDIVEAGEPIATNTTLTGKTHGVVTAPRDGIVLGMATIPSVAPGDPIVHLAFAKKGVISKINRMVDSGKEDELHERIREDLARSVHVSASPSLGK